MEENVGRPLGPQPTAGTAAGLQAGLAAVRGYANLGNKLLDTQGGWVISFDLCPTLAVATFPLQHSVKRS